MDLYIDRDAFSRGLSRVQNVVERRSTQPVLSHVLLSSRPDGLRMTATDTEVAFIGEWSPDGSRQLVRVRVPVTSLCPCSKEISDRGAHNQRGHVTVSVELRKFVWIEEIIPVFDSCATETIS